MKTENIGDVFAVHEDDAVIQHTSSKKPFEAGIESIPDQDSRLNAYYAQKMADQIPQGLRKDWTNEVAAWGCETKESVFEKSKKWFDIKELELSYAAAFRAWHWSREQGFQDSTDSLKNSQNKTASATVEIEPPEPKRQTREHVAVYDVAVLESASDPNSSTQEVVKTVEVLPPARTKLIFEEKQCQFHDLDTIVRNGAQTIVSVAFALARIRKEKLYKNDYRTFERYVESVQSMSRQYAYNILKSGQAALEMSAIADKTRWKVDQIPKTESHLRQLSRLKDPVRRWEVLSEVSNDKGPNYTAADLAKKIDPLVSRKSKKSPPSKNSPSGGGLNDEKTSELQAKVEGALDELEERLGSIPKLDPQVTRLICQIREWMNPKEEGLQ